MVSRGDIWLVQPEIGDGAAAHPCAVLSPPEIHDHLGVVIVAPIAAGKASAGFRVPLALDGQASALRLEQVRAIDTRRLTRQVGALERKQLNAALSALREMFTE